MCSDTTLLDSETHKYSRPPAHSPQAYEHQWHEVVQHTEHLMPSVNQSACNATSHIDQRHPSHHGTRQATGRSPAELFSASAWKVKRRYWSLPDSHAPISPTTFSNPCPLLRDAPPWTARHRGCLHPPCIAYIRMASANESVRCLYQLECALVLCKCAVFG